MALTVFHGIEIDMDALAEICRRYHVRELSLFGSVLRDDFCEDSDVDVLVEYEPEARVSLFDMSDLQYELMELFGREVDLVSKRVLRRGYRERILSTCEPLYGTGHRQIDLSEFPTTMQTPDGLEAEGSRGRVRGQSRSIRLR